MTEDYREFSRVSVNIEATIKTDATAIETKHTRDLSMNGIFVLCDEKLPLDSECEVSLILRGEAELLQVDIAAKVQRATEEGLGLEFVELGLESYRHLQNLILYNSQDAHRAEEEISAHLGLKKSKNSA